jgi:hypothetical protein
MVGPICQVTIQLAMRLAQCAKAMVHLHNLHLGFYVDRSKKKK